MRTTREFGEIELNTFKEHGYLLPILEIIARDEGDDERAHEIKFAMAATKSTQEEGYSQPPKPFRLSYNEAADLTVAISTERSYLEYFIQYGKMALQSTVVQEATPAQVEHTQVTLAHTCMDERAREITYMALDAMVEAVQNQASPEALLQVRPSQS